MNQNYPIISEEKAIGTATVSRQGLYYSIRCICKKPYRITVSCDTKQMNLGICVPTDGEFGLHTKIPVKRLGEGKLIFTVGAKAKLPAETFVPVHENEPFHHISKLKNARLALQNGQTGIVISTDHMSISSPTGQWSEPKTSE